VPAADGQTVQHWRDLSGNDRHLVQDTEANRPTWQSDGGAGDRPYVQFDGIDNYLRAAYDVTSPRHVFAVVMPSPTVKINGSVWDGNSTNTYRLYLNDTDSLRMLFGTGGPTQVSDSDAWQRVEARYDGAGSALRVDDSAYAAASCGTTAATGLTLGAAGGLTVFGDPLIAERIEYSRVLSAGEVVAVQAYLVERYAL
jgi:hypothetical protein